MVLAPALIWRIYRLPGSKEWWLVDHGPGSLVLQTKSWKSEGPTRSVANSAAHPRAWIEVKGTLYLDSERAIFYEVRNGLDEKKLAVDRAAHPGAFLGL